MKTTVSLPNSVETSDAAHFEKSLESVPGVVSIEVDDRELTIEHEGANEDELTNALKKLGIGC